MRRNSKVGNVQLMQKLNRTRVFDCIRRNEHVTRPTISAETGLSLSSITNIVTYLLEKEFVCEHDLDKAGHVGRKATLLRVNSNKYSIACVIIDNRRQIKAACMDLCGGIRFETKLQSVIENAQDAENAAAQAISRIIEKCGDDSVAAAAISVPGMVLDGGKEIVSASMRWTGLDLKTPLSEKFGIPVFIQNASIARAMWMLKELRGGKIGTGEYERNAVFMDLEQGIGAVQLMDQSVNPFFLGEIGHTTVERGGDKCTCGNRGCLELYCSAEKAVSDYGVPGASFADVIKAADSGDEKAREILVRCGEYLGTAFASVIHLINPSTIYINGAELVESDIIYRTATEWANRHCDCQLVRHMKYVKVSAREDSELDGLLEYSLDRLFDYESKHCIIE